MAKEFIERGALIARYDAEHVGSPGRARELMATAPAADVVEVVRCKDCKWYSELACGERELLGSQGWCNEVMARPMPSNSNINPADPRPVRVRKGRGWYLQTTNTGSGFIVYDIYR